MSSQSDHFYASLCDSVVYSSSGSLGDAVGSCPDNVFRGSCGGVVVGCSGVRCVGVARGSGDGVVVGLSGVWCDGVGRGSGGGV